jgi:preprotein translocase subunit SecY
LFDVIRNAWKIPDLRKKLLYTLMIIVVFRVGSAIPAPFMDATVLTGAVGNAGSLLGYIDILTGGAFSQATIFAMSISPYITSSIIVQLLTVAIPALEQMAKDGADGKKKLAKVTRFTTLALALIQSVAYYIMNRNLRDDAGNYGVLYRQGAECIFAAVVIVATFVGGSLLIVWLGEQIDKNGIGNGISMILFAGIISRAPSSIYYLYRQLELGVQYYAIVLAIVIVFLVLIASIVHMTNAERRIPVQYAKRVVGRKMYGGQSSFIPVKVTMSGVMPVIFASALLSIPGMIRGFIDPTKTRWASPDAWGGYSFLGHFFNAFEYNSWIYALLYVFLIIGFNYFYVAIQYNPVEMAHNLRKNNGAIPGIRPGKPTSDFIARVISKITLVGALFIAAVAILPIIIGGVSGINIALGGTSIIIVVGVALDTVRQLESQMMMRHYKGFLE